MTLMIKQRKRNVQKRQEMPFFGGGSTNAFYIAVADTWCIYAVYIFQPSIDFNSKDLILFSGVPLHLFFVSVFFGLMPYNYMCVTSGAILSELNDISEIMSWTNFGKISLHNIVFKLISCF